MRVLARGALEGAEAHRRDVRVMGWWEPERALPSPDLTHQRLKAFGNLNLVWGAAVVSSGAGMRRAQRR